MTEAAKIGVTVRDVPAADFIAAYAEMLKSNDKFKVPKWTDTVKTGVSRELAPYDPDWYFVRAGNRVFMNVYLYMYIFFIVPRKHFCPNECYHIDIY